MNEILAFTVTRASSPGRVKLLQDTLVNARKSAGMDFDWMVICSDCSPDAKKVVEVAANTESVKYPRFWGVNKGQHVAWNVAHELAKKEGYEFLLRIDDDCEFPSKRWLRKLYEASAIFDNKFILSPTIRGLNNPPHRSQPVTIRDLNVEFLFEAIGGICRLHPLPIIEDFTADVRKALGSGDATGIATYCREKVIPMVYLKHIRIKHAKTTRGQEESDPAHFNEHALFQRVPYIPPWTSE